MRTKIKPNSMKIGHDPCRFFYFFAIFSLFYFLFPFVNSFPSLYKCVNNYWISDNGTWWCSKPSSNRTKKVEIDGVTAAAGYEVPVCPWRLLGMGAWQEGKRGSLREIAGSKTGTTCGSGSSERRGRQDEIGLVRVEAGVNLPLLCSALAPACRDWVMWLEGLWQPGAESCARGSREGSALSDNCNLMISTNASNSKWLRVRTGFGI